METFILKTRAELKDIWMDCFFGVQQQREFASAFVDGPFDDDLLSAHESELDRMRGFYHDNTEIFELVKKREDLYQQYLEMEVRCMVNIQLLHLCHCTYLAQGQ
jgi:protein regulator of cytokinesis 1